MVTPKSLNLRTKLILIITGIIIPLMISSLSIVSYLINRESLQFLKQDLIKTVTAFNEFKGSRDSLLTLACEYAFDNSPLRARISSRNHKLDRFAQKLLNLFHLDLLVLQDRQNKVLFRFPGNLETDIGPEERRTRRSNVFYGLFSSQNTLYQIASIKLKAKGVAVGRIIVGLRISDDHAKSIKKITNSEISFVAHNQIVATTLRDPVLLNGLRGYVEKIITNRRFDLLTSKKSVRIAGENFLVNLIPLKDIEGKIFGYFVVQRSTEKILNFNNNIKHTLFLIIIAFWLCTGLVVGIFIQRHMVQPISNLVNAVNAIAKGDLSPNLRVESNDEIGFLYQGFNRMASEVRNWTVKLKEKNDELKRHSQRIEEVNQEMQDFVYVVSHDLKSPLVNIQGFTGRLAKLFLNTKTQLEDLYRELDHEPFKNGYTERLQKILKAIEERGPQSFEFIHTASKKMNDMIEELLALSRVDTRRMPMEPTNINEELENIIKAVEYEIQEKKIRIDVDSMPTIVCERARINQVFTNLITNAIKFIGEGPNKKIKIGYKDRGDYHLFYVKDNGIGIDAKDHKRIFRVFYRGDTKTSGHGMGLSLAKKIITKHEGKIWLDSAPGKGSTFYFTIKKIPQTGP